MDKLLKSGFKVAGKAKSIAGKAKSVAGKAKSVAGKAKSIAGKAKSVAGKVGKAKEMFDRADSSSIGKMVKQRAQRHLDTSSDDDSSSASSEDYEPRRPISRRRKKTIYSDENDEPIKQSSHRKQQIKGKIKSLKSQIRKLEIELDELGKKYNIV